MLLQCAGGTQWVALMDWEELEELTTLPSTTSSTMVTTLRVVVEEEWLMGNTETQVLTDDHFRNQLTFLLSVQLLD